MIGTKTALALWFGVGMMMIKTYCRRDSSRSEYLAAVQLFRYLGKYTDVESAI